MSLRMKTLAIIGVTFVGLIVLLYVAARLILLDSFDKLEQQEAARSVERAQSALADELFNLDTSVGDWALWDETYTFIQGANEEYIQTNLPDSALVTLRVNLMLFITPAGQIFYSKAVDLQTEQAISMPGGLQKDWPADDPLLRHANPESHITGILLVAEGPILVASRPIVTSQHEGPIRGTLIMGRFLNATEVARLTKLTHLPIVVRRLNDSQLPVDFQAARAAVSPAVPIYVQPLTEETVAGYTLLSDVYSAPILLLRTEMPRDIYQQGQTSLAYLMLALMAAGLVFGVMTMVLLENQVVSRLAHASKAVRRIGVSGDLTARLTMTGQDELAHLARAINEMLAALERSQEELHKSEALARRSRYLETMSQVSRDAASVLDPQQLLIEVVTLVSARFGFYHVGIFLLDASGEWAVLQAASSEGGQRMLARGDQVRVGSESLVGHVTAQGQPRMARTEGAGAVLFANPDLPGSRSAIALPLWVRGEIIGALDVQSTAPGAFDEEDVTVLQILADQIAVAISNARLFQQAQESLEAERRAYGELSREGWQELTRTRPDLGQRYDPQGILPADGSWRDEMKQALKTGEPVSSKDGVSATLAIPLKVRDQVIGVLNAYKPAGESEWKPEEMALLQTLVDQLGLALDSARLYEDAQSLAARERLLGEITGRIRETLDVDTVLKTAVQEARQALGLPEVVIRLVPPVSAARAGHGHHGEEGRA